MKKGNILIIGLICIANAGVVISAGNFSKMENAIEIKEKQKSNQNLIPFELELTEKNVITSYKTDTNNNQIKNYFRKQEYEGYNEALLAKSEMVSEVRTETKTSLDGTTSVIYPEIGKEINNQVNSLIKYQLTPYKSLYNSQTEQVIYTTMNIKNETSENINLKLKITEFTSTQDWSIYINQTNWNTIENNYNIINEIKNPENEQKYNERIQIITEPLTNIVNNYITIETKVEIKEETTTYHFIYIEPYIETESSIYDKIETKNPYTFIGIANNPKPKITGTIIPNVSDYEVIDIPGLMFNILTMPFSFISTAFNLTLFPGTPYQINLSNLILTVMAIFIFVFIIKKIFIK